MLAAHVPGEEGLFHFGDVDGRHEHVVADGREQAVGDVQHARLLLGGQGQDPLDQWREQLLIVDHRHHGEKHHQQRRERHGVLERGAQAVLVGDAGERGDQHDHHQPDQAHFRHVKGQPGNQDQRGHALHDQRCTLARGAFGIVLGGVIGQHGAYVVRQQGAVAKPAQFFQQDAGDQACDQHRQGNRGDLQEEFGEVPAHFMADQQVLRFADQRTHATQRRTHGTVHQQAAQKCAELLEVGVMQGGQVLIIAEFAVLTRIATRGDAVVHRVKPDGGTDDHRGHGQGIEKRRQERRQKAEHQRQQGFAAHTRAAGARTGTAAGLS